MGTLTKPLTGAEMKTLYEGEPNAFTDAKNTKLAGVDTGAKDDQTGAEIKTAYEGEANAFTDAKNTKLAGVDTGAKDDQTGAEIKTAYEGEANAFTDAKNTKLAGVEIWVADTTVIKASSTNVAYTEIDLSAIIGANKNAIVAFKNRGDAVDGDGEGYIGIDSGAPAAGIREQNRIKSYNASDINAIVVIRGSSFWWKCSSTTTLTLIGYQLLD